MSNNSQLGLVKTGYNCTVTGRGYDWVTTGSKCSCDQCDWFLMVLVWFLTYLEIL